MVTDITSNPDMPFVEVGLTYYREPSLTDEDTWAIDYNQVCKNYNVDIVDIDGVWVFTKITSFLSLVFGGAGVLLIWFSTCFIFSKKTWRWVGCELLTATLFKLLSFSWLATRMCTTNGNNCSINYGVRADIVACVMWFVSGVFVLLRYPNPKGVDTPVSNPSSSFWVANPESNPSSNPATSEVEMPDIS
jgi:hypothetical protein